MTKDWPEKLQKFQATRKAKAAWYKKTASEILQENKITVCYKCDCHGWGKVTGHSRAHAHVKARKICLASSQEDVSFG